MAEFFKDFSVSKLGPGDLIDRTVRFYRKNFWTLVAISSPPIIFGTLISVGWTIAGRGLFAVNERNPAEAIYYNLFLLAGNALIWLTESIATLVIMGGASRNFVRHILFGDRVTFAQTYKNVGARFLGLLAASTIIACILGVVGGVIFYAGVLLMGLSILLVVYVFNSIPVVAVILSVLIGIGASIGVLWLFTLVASRFAYVPQVMLVEGQGLFTAIGRSASLASGNVRRLMALLVFTFVATYSALALLYVPLAWYASANGVELFTFDKDAIPAWYEIAGNLIWQISLILLSPVWTVGLCLLYVDERVRHEGYDIELMAARRLGEIPDVPPSYLNPLQPAISNSAAVINANPAAADPPLGRPQSITTLGLK